LLRVLTIEITPGHPLRFTFTDEGTGSTNYAVEFSPVVGSGASWSNLASAVITPLGAGNYQVAAEAPTTGRGFYRVRGLGATITPITVSFSATGFEATEGGMAAPTLTLSAPFFGIVHYTLSGTAMLGDYVMLSGEVFVNGTTAAIPVTLIDNERIGQLNYLTLTLQPGPGLQLGAASETTVTIEENDAEWQGSFKTGDTTLGFILKIQQSNGTHTASLKSDGLGFFPTNEIPAALAFDTNVFAASVGNIALAAAATSFYAPLNLTFFLSATNGVANQSVSSAQVEGVATLVTEVGGRPFLNTTNHGTFLLLRPPVKPSTNDVDLVAVP
jgi:hypothetical protein